MLQILVTADAKFVGSHIAARLRQAGYRVRVLDSLSDQVHGGCAPGIHGQRVPAAVKQGCNVGSGRRISFEKSPIAWPPYLASNRWLHHRAPKFSLDRWRQGDQRYYVSDIQKFIAGTDWSPKGGTADGVRWLNQRLSTSQLPTLNAARQFERFLAREAAS